MVSNYGNQGVFFGRVLLQASTQMGGYRSVFVEVGGKKNDLAMPSWGGQLKNPFTVPAKFWAGDLFELRYDDKGENPELYLLKVFKAKKASTTTITLYRDGFSHIPCVGDIIMVAPAEIGGQGKAHKITEVTEGNDGTNDVWTVKVNSALDAITDGTILVEGDSDSDTGKMLVKTINCVAPCDGDFVWMPTTGANNVTSAARMWYTPMMHGTMYIHKMTCGKLPACVMKLNKSRFNGWFEV